MLQNRVDPLGNFITTTARGQWLGNRGVIHNDRRQIVRPFRTKAWIICKLQYKDRHRVVMTPGRWTELFFLDEATAFAAGHRPCFECRREDAQRFKSCWLKGNPEHDFTMTTSISAIDEIIHRERIEGTIKKIYRYEGAGLPEGSFVSHNGQAHLYHGGLLHCWTPFGYDQHSPSANLSGLDILTPRSIVNAFQAGYVPQVHDSAL